MANIYAFHASRTLLASWTKQEYVTSSLPFSQKQIGYDNQVKDIKYAIIQRTNNISFTTNESVINPKVLIDT